MKHLHAFAVVVMVINATDIIAEERQDRQGEIALIEIVSSGASTYEPDQGYYTGYLHAKTIETKGKSLPPKFKLFYKRHEASGTGATPWNNLPAGPAGRQGIHNGERIVGAFIQTEDGWEALPRENDFSLSRPEDMAETRLQRVQAHFATPLIQTWVPSGDVLADVLDRVQWRMSVTEFKQAFKNASVAEGEWQLARRSFRKTMVMKHPNTDILFLFSGIVDNQSENNAPLSSSLISFQVKHPLQRHPQASFQRPPQSIHFKYIMKLRDAYISRLDDEEVKYKRAESIRSSAGDRYMTSEKFTTDTAGTVVFAYVGYAGGNGGVLADAPPALIAEGLEKERASAAKATKDWPIGVCGND